MRLLVSLLRGSKRGGRKEDVGCRLEEVEEEAEAAWCGSGFGGPDVSADDGRTHSPMV